MAIRGPKGAHPTRRGWVNPKTGELLKSQKISEEDIAAFFGVVVEEPTPAPEPAPMVQATTKCEDCNCGDECNCDPCVCKMTKVQLEEHGRTLGIELDRRKTKESMLQDLNDFMNA